MPLFRWKSYDTLKVILICLISFLVLAAAATRVEMSGAIGLSHDEVISVVTAQGNVERYNEAIQQLASTQWVPAAEWQSFYYETTARSLAEIADDLAETDIHPPLYFWILRPWVATFGADAARLLNLPILFIGAAFLFAFACRYVSAAGALLAVSIWLLSPETIRTTATARQYELLGLFAIMTAWQAARLIDGKTDWRNLAGFAAIALGAMLTQYLAAIFILTALAVVIANRRKILAPLGAALVSAAFLFCLLHPGFYRHVGNYETAAGFDERLIEAASTLLGFWGWRNTWTTPAIAWATLIVTAVGMIWGVWLLRSARYRLPIALSVVPLGIALTVYLSALTPSHGFAGRHLSFVWPFLALLHVMAIKQIEKRAVIPALVLSAVIVAPSEFWLSYRKKPDNEFARIISSAPQIVLNNTGMGILPRYLRDARSDAAVYVSEKLPTDETWFDKLRPGAIIIINAQYVSEDNVRRVENIIKNKFKRVLKIYTTTIYRRE